MKRCKPSMGLPLRKTVLPMLGLERLAQKFKKKGGDDMVVICKCGSFLKMTSPHDGKISRGVCEKCRVSRVSRIMLQTGPKKRKSPVAAKLKGLFTQNNFILKKVA